MAFEGKSDLEKQLPGKLRNWRTPNTRFVVLRDKDSEDCRVAKEHLRQLCANAHHPEALVRIACHELESWYLGDLAAVEQALAMPGLGERQKRAKYRNPDHLGNAAEELTKLTANRYQKIAGSRAIGRVLNLDRNRSHSFTVFVTGLRRILGNAPVTNAHSP